MNAGAANAAPALSKESKQVTPYIIIKQSGFACRFCDAAVELLEHHGHPYQLRVLARDDLLSEAKTANMTTVPIIYHGGRLVGGFSQLKGEFYTP